MRVLVACEFTGTVRDAFIRTGHDAISCDLLPSESDFGPHYQGDIFDILYSEDWDIMIGHPPCTYLTNSGVQHLYEEWTLEERCDRNLRRDTARSPRIDQARWDNMLEGAEFFNRLWNAPVRRIAIENPIMHGQARDLTGGKATQYVQPWEYGHMESKRTGLRLKSLPPLTPTANVYEPMMELPAKIRNRVHYMSPGPERQKERSRFFTGIADAMAQQWGTL